MSSLCLPSIGLARRRIAILAAVALLMHSLVLAVSAPVTAAPGSDASAVSTHPAQNVDWMSPETASSLDIDIPVLVPTAVPSPFSGAPSVSVSGGYYSLYWVNHGGEPTFLQITGTAGGSLPAGSPYDLNIELSINESVQGHEAIHDVTPIYDSVWWIADGVLYYVTSLNMNGGSLALANELIALQPPAVDPPAEPELPVEPDPTEPPVEGEPEPSDTGADEPPPADDLPPADDGSQTEAGTDASPVEETETDGEGAEDVPGEEAEGVNADEAPEASEDEESGEETADEPNESSSGSTGTNGRVPTDGTDGPPRPVYGDGTGGPGYDGRLPQD